jgi:hypothetical protein
MIAIENLEDGSLVNHYQRPGVWRIVGLVAGRALIEPWDDAAAAGFHPAEAYVIAARVTLLRRLRPGGADAQ